jgi:hypothetical protein
VNIRAQSSQLQETRGERPTITGRCWGAPALLELDPGEKEEGPEPRVLLGSPFRLASSPSPTSTYPLTLHHKA